MTAKPSPDVTGRTLPPPRQSPAPRSRGWWPPVIVGLAVLVWGSGCASSEVREVNVTAVAPRVSFSSRDLPIQALQALCLKDTRAADYQVGPEDLLEVEVFGLEARQNSQNARATRSRVSETGEIILPVVGNLRVGGHTVDAIQRLIEKRLVDAGLLLQPQVNVGILEYQSKRLAVLGAVRNPGVYNLRRNRLTLLEAIALAGGVAEQAGQVCQVVQAAPPAMAATPTPDTAAPAVGVIVPPVGAANLTGDATRPAADAAPAEPPVTPTAAPATPVAAAAAGGTEDTGNPTADAATPAAPAAVTPAAVPAGQPRQVQIDLFELLDRGDLSRNLTLGHGDVVYVPVASRFSVLGFVREPGAFSLARPTTVLEGLAMAKGLQEDAASPRLTVLKRRRTDGGEVILPLDLVAISRGEQPNQYLLPDDVIEVRQSAGRYVWSGIRDFFHLGLQAGYSLN